MNIAESVAARRACGLRTRQMQLLLAAGIAVQVLVRLILGIGQTAPVLIPDETGYLLGARLLSGGAAGDLSGRIFYEAGYALLISPAYWVTDDPDTVYRLVIGINALLGAALLFPAYAAARRMGLRRAPAFALANLAALFPAGLYFGQFALSDAVLPLVVSVWLLAVHTWLRRADVRFGLLAAALASYADCTHPRGLVVVLVQVALLVAAPWVNRRVRLPQIALITISLTVTCGLAWALNEWVRGRLYPAGTADLSGLLWERLTSGDGLLWTVSLVAGKLWYLVVATWGLAGVGLVVLLAVLVSRRATRATRTTIAAALLLLIGIAVATSAAVPNEGTVANYAYGRYLSCLTPFLALVGGTALLRTTTAVRALVTLAGGGIAVVCAKIVWMLNGDRLRTAFFGPFDFTEICFLTWTWNELRLWPATWTALLLLALAALLPAALRTQYAATGFAVALMAVNLAAAVVTTDRVSTYWVERLTSQTTLKVAGLKPHDRVAMSYPGMKWRVWTTQAFQVSSGLVPFDRHARAEPDPRITLIVVPWDPRFPPTTSWPAARKGWHPVAVVSGNAGSWAAWRKASQAR
jgi:hypothetical protein